jgi:ribosome production factor 1
MNERSDKKLEVLKKKRLREEHGEKEVPKGETKTIESMRVKDETIITEADAMDEDFIGEKEIDEFSKYFDGKTTPRILLTTNRRPKGVSKTLC